MAEYFFGITDKGKRRETNEDTFIAREVSGKELLLACVIDGVGGYNGGEVAAEIARSVIIEHLENVTGNITEAMQLAIITANERIQLERNGNEQHARMACVLTCAIVDITNNKFYYAHVGDTRLYLLRDASLVKISKDHSAIGYLEESGRLSEDDAMRHPRRNEINRALGFEAGIDTVPDYIETGESPFLPGDIILLCSDGLSDMIGSAAITTILNRNRRLAFKAQELVDAANEAGGNDNITAVLVENNKPQQKQVALKPAEKKNGAIGVSASKEPVASNPQNADSSKNNRGTIILLALLSLLLLIALAATLFQQQKNRKNSAAAPVIPKEKAKDQQWLQLMAATGDSSKTYALPAGHSILVNEQAFIDRDSFYIRGNGAHIVADSNYTGSAFLIGGKARHIVLDSLVFENFNTALFIQKNNVVLKHVRFINCKLPVQYGIALPDSTISGRFKDSIFITIQSSKKR